MSFNEENFMLSIYFDIVEIYWSCWFYPLKNLRVFHVNLSLLSSFFFLVILAFIIDVLLSLSLLDFYLTPQEDGKDIGAS